MDFYHFMEELDAEFEERQAEVSAKLIELAALLFRPENLIAGYTAERKSLDALTEQVEILKTELYQNGGSKAPAWTIVP